MNSKSAASQLSEQQHMPCPATEASSSFGKSNSDAEAFGPIHPDVQHPNWKEIFGAKRPLHCEIGSGRGAFCLDFAQQNDLNLVAIELRRSDCEQIKEKRDKRGIRNLEILQGDARILLPRLFPEESVDAFHVHCPDPWWKKRHHRRRLIADDFALLLYRLLKPGGQLDLRTDVPAYAEAMVETCEELIGFENAFGPATERPEDGIVLSSRERRYARIGQPVYRYLYIRPDRPPLSDDTSRAFLRRAWTDMRRK